jgi:hypothetical protein
MRFDKKYKKFVIVLAILILLCNVNASKNEPEVKILQYILRDRIVLTDKLNMKKALYVAIQLINSPGGLYEKRIYGSFLSEGKLLSEYAIKNLKGEYENLVFDLPFKMPAGIYAIVIKVFSSKGKLYAEKSITLERSELKPSTNKVKKKFSPKMKEKPQPIEKIAFSPSNKDNNQDFILFSRSPLLHVFPDSKPKENEIVDEFHVIMAQNEFEPLSFTIFPLSDLGQVTVSFTNLIGSKGIISKKELKLFHVEEVDSTIGMEKGLYQKVPMLLRPINNAIARKGKCERFWLTIRADKKVEPGVYDGSIQIKNDFGKKHSVPLKVEIVPIILEDIPGIDYFMMMTYEFVELTMPWSESQKKKIYISALNVIRDYKDHGMTTVCFHSPFIQLKDENGSIILADIFSALRGANEVGFSRPIIYYLGHLIQTAKPKHPGNIHSFNEKIQVPKLKKIVRRIMAYSAENDFPDVIFLPIDEPHDRCNDPKEARKRIAPMLLANINELGARTILTGSKLDTKVDYFCTGKIKNKQLIEARKRKIRYWMYDNAVTLLADNPAYARYKYGYFVWRNGIDGMSSWTFQNTQNASGFPGIADTTGREVFLAFPDPEGPLATLRWEAIREGIDDYKLIYQLEQRIQALNKIGVETNTYSNYLLNLKQRHGQPEFSYRNANDWDHAFFESARLKIISFILDADNKLRANKSAFIN